MTKDDEPRANDGQCHERDSAVSLELSACVLPPSSVLDVGHEGCGTLLVLIFQTMRTLAPGAVLEVVGYDPGAQVDIPAWCRMTGHVLLETRGDLRRGEPIHYRIRKKEHSRGQTDGEHHIREG